MSFNFREIPYELKLSIAQKMNLSTLTKMRQTSKFVDALIEKNRFKIKAMSSGDQAILKISIDVKKMALTTKVALIAIKEAIKYYSFLNFYIQMIPEEKFATIELPFEQLSAVKFDFVFLDCDIKSIGWASMIRENELVQAAALEVFPLLDRLRLNCEWLILTTSDLNKNPMDILSKIKFQKLCYDGPCDINGIQEWPIQSCDECHIGTLEEVPERIFSLAKNLNNASFTFYADYGTKDMINTFLMEIKEDRSVKGSLKTIWFFFDSEDNMGTIECFDAIWEGNSVCGEETTVFKTKIDGGVAYLKLWLGFCEIKFFEEDCDKEIISECIPCCCTVSCVLD